MDNKNKMKKVKDWWFPNSDEHLSRAVEKPTWLSRGFDYQTQQRDYSIHLANTYFSRSRRAIDIGAHVGLWTVDLCRYFRRVECFEPIPLFRDCLKQNLKENKIDVEGYAIHPNALGKEEKEVRMTIDKHNTGATHIASDGHIKVLMKKLDSFKFDGVDYIKIDCEGSELSIIYGARKTIQINKPIIVMESKANKMGYSAFVTAKHLLYKWGYKIDNSIESETIFVHRYNIKRDWDKGKKQQRKEDPLRPQLDPDYSQYEDKKEFSGPDVLSDGNSAYRIYEDEDKDDNDLE
jgi:FkbM family methyltransferase